MAHYPEYKQLDLVAINQDILTLWQETQAFKKSIQTRDGKPEFVFYEGPPSANGKPGIHHVMARTIKDLFCRYKTQQGFKVERKSGWDTHGLPIELQVEKKLGITKDDIGKTISIEEYNRLCRQDVMMFTQEWENLTSQMGYWVDLENPYITYENKYIESVWSILKKLHSKGLIYKGYTIQPYSPAAGTGLSSHELNQPGTYKNVRDTTAVAMFKVSGQQKSPFSGNDLSNAFFLAWTTTPWTLPSNTALTVGAKNEYSLIQTLNPYTGTPVDLILATKLISKYFKAEDENTSFEDFKVGNKNLPWKSLGTVLGKELKGLRYEQLLPYAQPETGDAFLVLTGDFVTTEDGTGIVHTAPSFGADDFRLARENGVGTLTLVNRSGKFLSSVTDFANEFVKEQYLSDEEKAAWCKANGKEKYLSIDERIAIKLKIEGKAFKVEKYEHTYPHCWRTDKPILYYPLDSWFIRTTDYKERLVALNNTINWKPESTGTGRFGNWLENLVDWNLSRSRFWGTPLPIWRTADATEEICIGSIDELNTEINKAVAAGFMDNNPLSLMEASTSFDATHAITQAESLIWVSLQKNVPGISRCQSFGSFSVDFVHHLSKLIIEIDEPHHALNKEFNANRDHYFESIGYKTLRFTNAEVLVNETLVLESVQSHIDHRAKSLDKSFFDLHRPYVDQITLVSASGKPMTRETDLIDVWFDSGAVPYAQNHFLASDATENPTQFPADFIAEGVDQTRGWFFTLHALAVMLFDSVAFKNVVSNGLVLDKHGNKMSKRLGNGIDPFDTLNKYGADATRWYMVRNSDPWENLKFDLEGIKEVQRAFFGTLYNTYSFFALYANIDNFAFTESEIPVKNRPEIDQWILSRLHTLIRETELAYNDYEPTKAARAMERFVDEHLSNWYVRLCRRRFWKGEYSTDKIAAYQTLYTCLETLSLLMAPIAPFFADRLFLDLNKITNRFTEASVHHTLFPKVDEKIIDDMLNDRMELAQTASSLILSLRKRENIKVRQPLSRILVPITDAKQKDQFIKVEELIKAEVNVKGIEYITDTNGVVTKKLKLNFKSLGGRVGAKMKALTLMANTFTQNQINTFESEGKLVLTLENESFELITGDAEIVSEDIPGWLVANEGRVTVALDITITNELKNEGIAREIVNRVQKLRKDSDFDIIDKIIIHLEPIDYIRESIEAFSSYICNETLANSININLLENVAFDSTIEIDEYIIGITLKKT